MDTRLNTKDHQKIGECYTSITVFFEARGTFSWPKQIAFRVKELIGSIT